MTPIQQKTVKAIVNVFETGRAAGDYSSVTVLAGDAGHLTYGRSQSSLGSGSLYQLLRQYCAVPGAQFAAHIQPYLGRIQRRDISLDNDANLRSILRAAGSDPVMQAAQDAFFDENYFNPACASAAACGLNSALAHAVVYDSCVQGNWHALRDATNSRCGAVGTNGVTEQQWVKTYVETRRAWLASAKPPLPASAYRMDAFLQLIGAARWDLSLPVQVHGVTITEADVESAIASRADEPVLRLTNPPMSGDAVKKLQAALAAAGIACAQDGAFGASTEAAVKAFQASKGLPQDGVVGPATWRALGVKD